MMNEYAQIAHQKFLAREHEKLRADKRLRDAAPDLLAALKNLLERSGHLSVFGSDPSVKAVRQAGDYIKAVDIARAAIAKAEGTK